MGDQRKKLPLDDLLALKTSGVIVQDATAFYEVAMGKLPVETLRLSWLIFSPGFKDVYGDIDLQAGCLSASREHRPAAPSPPDRIDCTGDKA